LSATFPSAPSANKPPRPTLIDRLDLWLLSTGRDVDGLWVGTIEDKPYPGLQRVEDALRLVKCHAPLHYSRIIRHLQRIWVRLIPNALAHYDLSLNACALDKRYVLAEATTVERIASSIVHEATHARLERWGVRYDEKVRARIEAICLRRELDFLSRLQNTEALRDEIARTLEWCAGDHDWFSNASFARRADEGNAEALRYLGAPDWLIEGTLKARTFILPVRRLIHRLFGFARGGIPADHVDGERPARD
jgi:hypothetical protein